MGQVRAWQRGGCVYPQPPRSHHGVVLLEATTFVALGSIAGPQPQSVRLHVCSLRQIRVTPRVTPPSLGTSLGTR